LVDIFSGAFLKSEKVVRPKNKSLIIIKLQGSPTRSSAVLMGQVDRLFCVSITVALFLYDKKKQKRFNIKVYLTKITTLLIASKKNDYIRIVFNTP
jgi:hypothetical protein